MLGTVATIAREEGLSALWKGIIPGLHRQFIYGGLRIGLYEPVSVKFHAYLILVLHSYACSLYKLPMIQVKAFFVGSDFAGDVSLFQKILAALITGKQIC